MTFNLRPGAAEGNASVSIKGISWTLAASFSLLTCREDGPASCVLRCCPAAGPADAMGFGDLKSPAGLQVLNDYLADRSYIEG